MGRQTSTESQRLDQDRRACNGCCSTVQYTKWLHCTKKALHSFWVYSPIWINYYGTPDLYTVRYHYNVVNFLQILTKDTPIARTLQQGVGCPLWFQSLINSLWPSDTIRRHKSGSTLAQVMACCLTAPSHYLNQCWLIISMVEWQPSKGKFTKDTSAINHWNYL